MKVPGQSKKKLKEAQRKAKYLQSKREKFKQREGNIQALHDNSLDPSLLGALLSSKSLGSTQSLKNQLKLELQKEKLGLPHSQILYTEKTVSSSDYSKPAHTLFPIYKPIAKVFSPSSSSESLEFTTIPLKPEPLFKPFTEYIPNPIADLNQTTLMGYTEGPVPLPSELLSKDLPIAQLEQEIIETIRYNPITILCGETGSGKSTQLPQYLMENAFTDKGKIGITQPRRIATAALAQRVSDEIGAILGTTIGYQVRYNSENISSENIVKFMTDGILLKEIASDFLLSEYSVIIIDEAHERSINTDILLGLLSRIVPLRAKKAEENIGTPLKLVIMSATLRVSDFTENKKLFPVPPPVIQIDSRQFPVTTHFTKTTKTPTYLEQSLSKAIKIHNTLPPGGILIFLPGKKDVLLLKSQLKSSLPKSQVKVLSLFSMLSLKKQLQIFSPQTKRLIVVSTNVAETSITIPNIVYVIDSGLEKRKVYSAELQMSKFEVCYISQASASQRSGRAGRTSPGHCYRLYSNAAFSNVFEMFRKPDICTSPLSPIVLQLKAIGIKNVLKFPFPTCPPAEALQEALDLLVDLGALSQCRTGKGDVYNINSLGEEMAKLPIAPRYAKMLITGKLLQVAKWMCPIVAGIEIEQIFDMDFQGTSKEKLTKAKKIHSKWFTGGSDCLSALKIFLKFIEEKDIEGFCEREKIIEKSLIEMKKLTGQLLELVAGEKKSGEKFLDFQGTPSKAEEILILKSITSGFLDQIAWKVEVVEGKISKRVPYSTQKPMDLSMFPVDYSANKSHCFIHPSSYFFRRTPPGLIAYQQLSFITRPSLFNITEVQPQWLYELAPQFLHNFQVLDASPGYYDNQNDRINTWVSASYGKKMWTLPAAYLEYPECEMKYWWFAKLLLQGKIFIGEEISQWWTVKFTSVHDKGLARVQQKLFEKKIDKAQKIAEAVQTNPNFLIDSLLQISKAEVKEKVSAFWKISGLL